MHATTSIVAIVQRHSMSASLVDQHAPVLFAFAITRLPPINEPRLRSCIEPPAAFGAANFRFRLDQELGEFALFRKKARVGQ